MQREETARRTKGKGSSCRASCWLCWISRSRSTCQQRGHFRNFHTQKIHRVRAPPECVIHLPHEEEETGDDSRVLLQKSHRSNLTFPEPESKKEKRVRSTSTNLTHSVDQVGTGETDLTPRNRYPRPETTLRRSSAGWSPFSRRELEQTATSRAAKPGGAVYPRWGSRRHLRLR